MVAHDPFTGRTVKQTAVEFDADTSASYPNDPHVQAARRNDADKPQAKHSGYARGGTSNPVGDDDGAAKWFAPKDREDGGVGKAESTPEKMFARDREVNPVPYEGRATGPFADGTPVNRVEQHDSASADDGQPRTSKRGK